MLVRSLVFCFFCLACLGVCFSELTAQEPGLSPQAQQPQQLQNIQQQQQPPQDPNATPPVPQGVEVLARGPIHEAFATPTTEPVPGQPVSKAPPKPVDEMPPAEKPSGDAA